MNYQDYVTLGLNGEHKLKLILCGYVEDSSDSKVGVVSVVYATYNKDVAKEKLEELNKKNPDKYYMVYSVPEDVDLTTLGHYPSIAIGKE